MLYVDRPLAANACWIWLRDLTEANRYAEFHRVLNLEELPAEAWIQLSAETSLRLWINGKLIHSGPPREVPPYFYFDTIDLLPLLQTGANDVRLIAHHQGKNSQSYQAGTPAILVAGQCANGEAILTDFADPHGWSARPITRYLPDAHRLFVCIGFSEHVDFDAPEVPWTEALEVARHPWPERPTALSRDLPALTESERVPASLTPHADSWLIDFGTEVSGYVVLDFHADHPLTLRLSYSENLTDGRVTPEKGGMNYTDVLELPAREVTWRSYEKRAFRYLQLSEPIKPLRAKVIEQNYPYHRLFAEKESYRRNQTSEEGRLINRILETSARTIEINSEDLLTDCPWRERGQYFDCYFYTEAMLQLFGTLEPIRRFINQYSRGADATGLLRICYPSPAGFDVCPDFSISYAIHLNLYLELTGDLETVRRNLPFAQRGVTAFQQYEDADHLLVDVPGWIFIDNTFELPKFPRSAALNAVYYGGHLAVAKLLRACGDESSAMEFEAKAQEIRASFRRTFVREDRVLDSDSTLAHEAFRHWTYHYPAETGRWSGKSFRLHTTYRLHDAGTTLRLAVHAGGRAWIDGRLVTNIEQGGSWTNSAIYQSVELPTPQDTDWHRLDLEVEWSGIDWECYLSCAADVEWSACWVWEEPEYAACAPDAVRPANTLETRLRHQTPPWMTQATVGHAAFHGLLEPDEARRFLQACLPSAYSFPFAKRCTPFFAMIEDQPNPQRILPCNVPASMFHFCHALKRHGMASEARALLLPIYRGMLERGATTWWEEWNTRSSLCHAWGSFVVTFLEAPI